MIRRIAADEWNRMTNSERIECCNKMAKEAESAAQAADPSKAPAYRDLANHRLQLAAEIEGHAKRPFALI